MHPTQSALVDQITRQALLSDLVIHDFMMNAMRAMLEKSLPPVAISQVEIEEYYHQNSDLFSSPERRSIKHLFKAEHGAKSALEMDELRVKLNNGLISSDEAFKSTDLFYSGALVSGKTHLEIIALFGNPFAQSVWKLEARQWSQPITSVYGQHLVWVDQIAPIRQNGLADSSATIETTLANQKRELLLKQHIEDLKQGYQIFLREPLTDLANNRY